MFRCQCRAAHPFFNDKSSPLPQKIRGSVDSDLSRWSLRSYIVCSSMLCRGLHRSTRVVVLTALTATTATTTFLPHCVHGLSFSSMSSFTERDGKGTITVSPKRESDQSGLLVISHGLGDSAEGFVDVVEVRKCRLCVRLCLSMGGI